MHQAGQLGYIHLCQDITQGAAIHVLQHNRNLQTEGKHHLECGLCHINGFRILGWGGLVAKEPAIGMSHTATGGPWRLSPHEQGQIVTAREATSTWQSEPCARMQSRLRATPAHPLRTHLPIL